MHLNPVPFLFVPGVVAAGWMFGGWQGGATGFVAWSLFVGLATAFVVGRKLRRDRQSLSG